MPEPILTITKIARRDPRAGPAELWIEYTIANPTSEKVYVTNQLEDLLLMLSPKPRQRFSTELAYVFDAGSGAVLLYQGTYPRPPSPPGISYYCDWVAWASLLPKKTMLRATIREPLPLVEWAPYMEGADRNPPADPITVSRLVLRTNYALQSDLTDKPLEYDSDPGVYGVDGTLRRLEQSVALPEPVTLLRRKAPDFLRLV